MVAMIRFWSTCRRLALLLGLFITMQDIFSASSTKDPSRSLVYVGTYTGGASKGIYAFQFDSRTGEFTEPALVAETPNPTFLALSPDQRFLYAANEVGKFQGKPGGSISAYAIEKPSGKLSLLNQGSTRGDGPCHVVVDRTGKFVLAANYGGGSVAVIPIRKDGGLEEVSSFVQHTGSSVNPSRQKQPHAHSIHVDPANRFAIAADLGIDKLLVYKLDPVKGLLTPNEPAAFALKPGAGPRHLAFHPNMKFAYVINELQSTVTALRWDAAEGSFAEIQTVPTLPADFAGQSTTAEVVVHPSGKFLYGSNRGHDSIAVFAIDDATGRLTSIMRMATGGKTPRNFNLDPSGRWLWAANQDSNNLVLFAVDPSTGKLEATRKTIQVGAPVCIRFTPLP